MAESESTAAGAAPASADTPAPATSAPGGAGGAAGAGGGGAAAGDAPVAGEATGKKAKRWYPLESNPETMTAYIKRLGFPTMLYQFHDVMATEDWALEMTEKHRTEEAAKIEADGQTVSDSLYFTKQTVGNACGTVGLLHAVANASSFTGGDVSLVPDSFFDKFFKRTATMTPDERAEALEADDEIEMEHEAVAQEGQSEVVQDVETHFVAFVEKDGNLYELDGRKKFPINHGPTTPATLLKDAVAVVKQFMERDPGEMRFGITALGPAIPSE